MNEGEFTHIVKLRQIMQGPRILEASEEERRALAQRFQITAISKLKAEVNLLVDGTIVTANGRLQADIVQQCAVSGDDFPVHISEALAFRFAPETQAPADDELELDADDCDEIYYSGEGFDLGEAVAQSLGLAIDPFACGPNAEETRKKAGLLDESAAGPFAALAALKK